MSCMRDNTRNDTLAVTMPSKPESKTEVSPNLTQKQPYKIRVDL